MPDESSPQYLRQSLGARLRSLRLARGLTIDEAASRLLCSPSKISRMETGQRGATLRDVRDLCNIYEVEDETSREEMMALAEGGRRRREVRYDDRFVLPEFDELEKTAQAITVFVSTLIPALFQTAPYVRARLAGQFPELTPEDIESGVQAVAARQKVLTRKDPPDVRALLDEAALHRCVGGAAVMAEQLDRLCRIDTLPNVEILVVPFSVGAHVGAESSFVALEFGEGDVPDIVFSEGLAGVIRTRRDADVRRYRSAISMLVSSALDSSGSSRVLSAMREVYRSC